MESESQKFLRQQLESLNEVSQTLRHCQSIAEVVQKALAEVRKRLNVQVASIFLLSKDGVLKREGIDGVDKEGNLIDNSWFSEEQYEPGESFSGKALPPFEADSSYGKPPYSNKLVEEFPMVNAKRYIEKLGELKSGISVPLNDSYRTFGAFQVLNKRDGYGFSNDDIYWLTIIGTSVANFIEYFRHRENFKAYKAITEKLIDLEVDDKNFDLENLCQFVASKLTADFTPYKACIIRIADEKDDLEIRGKSSYLENHFFWQGREDVSIKAGSQIVGEVYTSKNPIFICNIDDIIQKFKNQEWLKKHQLKSFACLPLLCQNECVGTISVYTQYPHKFSDNYEAFLMNMAFLTAAIIARVRIINDLRQVRKERNEIYERLLNTSLLVSYDNLSQGVLHQYKNELINFYQFLDKISKSNDTSKKEKEQLINEQKEWITKRVAELQPELKTDEVVPVNINQAIKEVVESFSFEFSELDIKIELNYDDKIPLIAINKEKIKNIILNLLSNAKKAIQKTKRRKGKIVITTSIDIAERIKYIQMTLEDNGTGISNEIQDRIFERGFTTRQEEGGTGLGLFAVRKILNSYGGKINFLSSVGKGTKFYVKIPLKRYQV